MKGPTNNESGAETDENPTAEDVLGTVEWAVSYDHVELANFEFEDGGDPKPHLQLAGPTYNITKLSDDRAEVVQEILSEFVDDEAELDPDNDATAPYITVTVDATVDEHQRLVERLLREVYGVDLDGLASITRSAVAPTVDEPEDPLADADSPKAIRRRYEALDNREFEDLNGTVGGQFQIETGLDIEALAIGLGLERIEYEPSVFQGLVYRLSGDTFSSITAFLFENGQIAVVDAVDESEARDGIITVLERLADLDLLDAEIPSAEAIETMNLQE